MIKQSKRRCIVWDFVLATHEEIERFSKVCEVLRVAYSIRFIKRKDDLVGMQFRCYVSESEFKELDEMYHEIIGEMAS